MDHTPYSLYVPPKADLNGLVSERSLAEAEYFVFSPAWVLVLCPLTLGLFGAYWTYRQWQALERSGRRVNPAGRALFLVFFVHALFRDIASARYALGLVAGRAHGGMATSFIVLEVLASLARHAGPPFGWILSIVLTLGSAVPLSMAQDDVNAVAGNTGKDGNRRIGMGGRLLIALGVVLFLYRMVPWA